MAPQDESRTGRRVRRCTRSRCARAGSPSTGSAPATASTDCRNRRASSRGVLASRRTPPTGGLDALRSACSIPVVRDAAPAISTAGTACVDPDREEIVLKVLHLGPVIVDRSRYLPPVVRPLVHAAERGDDIIAPLQAIVRRSASTTSRMPRPTITSVPTTTSGCTCSRRCRRPGSCATTDRVRRVDPRVSFVFDNALPLVWDRERARRDVRTGDVSRNAAGFGLRSGVAFSVYCGLSVPATSSTLNSSRPLMDRARGSSSRAPGELAVTAIALQRSVRQGRDREGSRARAEGIR